jgi:hypothetical protein
MHLAVGREAQEQMAVAWKAQVEEDRGPAEVQEEAQVQNKV